MVKGDEIEFMMRRKERNYCDCIRKMNELVLLQVELTIYTR
jgi:hypothetical protein